MILCGWLGLKHQLTISRFRRLWLVRSLNSIVTSRWYRSCISGWFTENNHWSLWASLCYSGEATILVSQAAPGIERWVCFRRHCGVSWWWTVVLSDAMRRDRIALFNWISLFASKAFKFLTGLRSIQVTGRWIDMVALTLSSGILTVQIETVSRHSDWWKWTTVILRSAHSETAT